MCKKFAYLTVGVAAAFVVLSGLGLSTYVFMACNSIQEHVQSAIPIEAEIQRLEYEVQRLRPDLEANIVKVSNEMAKVKTEKTSLQTARAGLEKQKDKLRATLEQIKTGEANGTRNVQFQLDLEACKATELNLQRREEVLKSREQALELAKLRLHEIRNQEGALLVSIAELKTELERIQLAETRQTISVDDSRVSHIKQSIAKVRERIDARTNAMQLRGELFPGERTATQPPSPTVQPENLVRDGDQYLNGTNRVTTEEK